MGKHSMCMLVMVPEIVISDQLCVDRASLRLTGQSLGAGPSTVPSSQSLTETPSHQDIWTGD